MMKESERRKSIQRREGRKEGKKDLGEKERKGRKEE